MKVMRKEFNITGSCNPQWHYMVNTEKRKYVFSGKYGPNLMQEVNQYASIAAEIAKLPAEETFSLGTRKISTGELLEFAQYLRWEDLRLFGTPFQMKVWETLFHLPRRLYSYTG